MVVWRPATEVLARCGAKSREHFASLRESGDDAARNATLSADTCAIISVQSSVMSVDRDRLAEIGALRLGKGAHESFASGAGVMEAVAYIAGEPFSDHPWCASPVLGALLRAWNDCLDDETRQRLKPYAARLVGTAGSEDDEERRREMLWEWVLGTLVPRWLETAGMHTEAERVRVDGRQVLADVHGKAWESRMAARARVEALVRDYIDSASAAESAAPAAAVYEAAAFAAAAYVAEAACAAAAAEPSDADDLLANAAAFLDAAGTAAACLDEETDAYVAYAAGADSAVAAGYAYVEAAWSASVRELQETAFYLLDRLIDVGQNRT